MSDEESSSLIVAVRVRPFNSREKGKNASLAVKMQEKQTIITDPETQKPKIFTFDYSFWSHNSADEHFVDNQIVYDKIGKMVLKSAWEGFNSSLFAYGQTGAGKSYSMVGYGEDVGIIPKACDEIFQRIQQETTESKTFAVEASMLEIYNEQVRDLFNPSSFRPGGLKVREHPKTGVFVESLVSLPVHTYKEISDLMEQGSNARTVASTNMNATSSRAHTIFIIQLKQTEVERTETKEEKREKSSKISLIDLAGSERAGDTGATGDRLKEGCAINQSLTALGNVISALVKVSNTKSKKKKKEIFIPYRGSILTWLMKDSLGGNSKTIMIAAISPADICYEESVSTLKYANRAKQIKNKAVVNEDKNVKMIRELKKEVALLRKKLAEQGGDITALDGDEDDEASKVAQKELEELRAKLAESQSIISNLSKSDQDKEQEKQQISQVNSEKLAAAGVGVRLEDMLDKDDPLLVNMHPDEMMNGRIIFRLKEGENLVGKYPSKTLKPQIPLGGVGVAVQHVVIQRSGNHVSMIPQATQQGQKTFLNGMDLAKETELNHMDRIIIGSHTFRFINPVERRKKSEEELDAETEMDYYFAQQEFADKQGMSKVVQNTTDTEFEKKLKEMQEKMDREKRAQQEALQREKEEMERQRREMMENFQKLKTEAEKGSTSNVDMIEKQLAQRQKAAELKFQQQQQELARKRKKLEEEMARQEELSKQLQLKKKREGEQRALLEQNLLQLIPLVLEANSMSGELRKGVRFQTKLIAYLKDDGKGKQETHTDLGIQVINVKTGKKYMWNYDKFQNRYYLMQELYQNYLFAMENDTEFSVDPEKDPFYDFESNESHLVGISMLYLKALSHRIDMQIFTPIINNKGEKQGELECAVIPCSTDGKEVTSDFVSDPYTLEGEEIYFKVRIKGARGLPLDWCKESFVQYRVSFLEEKPCKTRVEEKRSTIPSFNYEKIYHVESVTKDFVDYLRNSAIKFEIMAKENTELSEVRRPGSSSRPSTAQQFELQQNAQLLDQLQKMTTDSKTTQDVRRIQRQGSMNAMMQQSMQNRMGNANPISQTKTVVQIDKDGRLMISHPPQGDASQTCVIS
mmetsp:Transcript_9199/g.33964  ORF Transcript_9199/g.33964 Transcript_9199/m.33964 type:complete len:1091 (-) Transcript_9199:60-3332(-)